MSFLLRAFSGMLAGAALAVAQFLPVPAEELGWTDDPKAPGEHAVRLYYEFHSDDVQSFATHYYRIKIFTEQGRQYADVRLPSLKQGMRVEDIQARTIRPDGTILNFNGEVFETTVLGTRKLKLVVKSFTLPEVSPGSIIEYRYRVRWSGEARNPPTWDIQAPLFTHRAVFSFRPASFAAWRRINLRDDTPAPVVKDRVYRVEFTNVPGTMQEDFLPPAHALYPRIAFHYVPSMPGSPWGYYVAEMVEVVNRFAGKAKSLDPVLQEVIAPTDPPDTKLRKLYGRVQQIRNLTFERATSEREEKSKVASTAAEVLKRGYGTGTEINLTFLALVRAAGIDAFWAMVGNRDTGLFDASVPDFSQFGGNVVEVRLGSVKLYLDPATWRCPFGMLPSELSGMRGVRIAGKEELTLRTPDSASADAVTERVMTMNLARDGTASGEIQVVFSGHEALERKLALRSSDTRESRKEIESEVKSWLPAEASVDLKTISGWDSSEEPLTAKLSVKMPRYTLSTPRRLIVPTLPFSSDRRLPRLWQSRVYPVFFPRPFEVRDRVELRLPEGYEVEALPESRSTKQDFGQYSSSVTHSDGVVKFERVLAMQGNYFPQAAHESLRAFVQVSGAGDDQVIIFESKATRK